MTGPCAKHTDEDLNGQSECMPGTSKGSGMGNARFERAAFDSGGHGGRYHVDMGPRAPHADFARLSATRETAGALLRSSQVHPG
jgi:hypothetical protein